MARVNTRRIDETGNRYGRLKVLGWLGEASLWICKCDCGQDKLVAGAQLRSGNTKSCGCFKIDLSREKQKKLVERATKHGLYDSTEYIIWSGIKQRCNNQDNKRFHHYGGRGIRVCDRWDASFEAFYADMGPRPSPQHSIDRIDNDGDYEPGNCRWATRTEQHNNMRNTRWVEYDGRRVTWANAYRELNPTISRETFFSRLSRGWEVERAAK